MIVIVGLQDIFGKEVRIKRIENTYYFVHNKVGCPFYSGSNELVFTLGEIKGKFKILNLEVKIEYSSCNGIVHEGYTIKIDYEDCLGENNQAILENVN